MSGAEGPGISHSVGIGGPDTMCCWAHSLWGAWVHNRSWARQNAHVYFNGEFFPTGKEVDLRFYFDYQGAGEGVEVN